MSITIELPPHEMFEIAEGVIREKQVEIDALKANVAALVDAARALVKSSAPFPGPGTLTAVATTDFDALRAALEVLS